MPTASPADRPAPRADPLDPASLPEPARSCRPSAHDPHAGHRRHGRGDGQPGARRRGEAGGRSRRARSTRPGLSQKAGPVVSTTVDRRARRRDGSTCCWRSTRCRRRHAANLGGLDPATSVAIVSTSVAPTGRMIGKVASMGIDLDPVEGRDRCPHDEREQPLRRRRRPHDRAVRQLGDGQRLRRRRGLPGRPDPAAGRRRSSRRSSSTAPPSRPTRPAFRWGRSWFVDPERGRATGRSHETAPQTRSGSTSARSTIRAPAVGRGPGGRPRRLPERQVRRRATSRRARGRRRRDRAAGGR